MERAPGRAAVGRLRSEGGFTLIEIAVGMVILVIGILGLAFAMVTAYRVERLAAEKKIALSWATAQIERLRSIPYSDLATAPPEGYLTPAAWGTTGARVGIQKSLDADADEDYFERYYYPPGTPNYVNGTNVVPLAEAALGGLRPPDGASFIGTVSFTDPSTTLHGVGEGAGYWVTVQVRWRGIVGNSSVKLSTFVGR